MATHALHFLTIVGRPGEEAIAGFEKLVASRLRLAKSDPDGDFEDTDDPLTSASSRDEHMIGAFARGLMATAHRLPTIGYSQFVFNFTTGGSLLDVLGPRADRAIIIGPQVLHSYNYQIAIFPSRDTTQTLQKVEAALARIRPRRNGKQRYIAEVRMYFEHLRAAHGIVSWVPTTIVVIEQCIYATREDYEIRAAALEPLGVPHPIYYDTRPATSSDRDAIVEVWLRSVRATHTFLTEVDIEAILPVVRDQLLANHDVTVLTADDDPAPVGFLAMSRNDIRSLFIDPAHHRRGGGRLLVREAYRGHASLRVDVNEQNPDAVAFYKAMGFKVVGRSEVDGQGRPFPLLHMRAGIY